MVPGMIGSGYNHSSIKAVASLWLLLCAWVCPQWAAAASESETAATYQRFRAIAGPAQDSVRFYRLHYWQPLSDRTLVLWLGREEPYLVDLRERCFELRQERFLRIADYQRPGRNMLRARWSSIITRNGHDCRITSIRALDFSRIDELAPRRLQHDTGPALSRPAGSAELTDERRWAALVSVLMEPPERLKNSAGRDKSGITHVAAQVAPDGRVIATEVLIGSGHRDLDSAALESVLRWRFEPYTSDDADLRVWVQVPVVFSP
jgi:TonB family protein